MTRRPRRAPALAALGLTLGTALGATLGSDQALAQGSAPSAELASLFPRRAALAGPAGELARLDVPAEVLAACRPDLSDLRIVAADGREVPYAVLEGLAPDRAVEVRETVTPEVRDLAIGSSAARRGDQEIPPIRFERFVLSPPPPAPAGERWRLVVVPDRSAAAGRRAEVVRRVVVTDLRGEPWERVEEEPGSSRLLASGSVFRVPSGPGARWLESLAVPLPILPEDTGDLLVALEGRDEEHLRPAFRYERVREIAGPPRTRIALETLDRRSEGGRTVVTLARPRGLVPDRLEIESSTPAFDRRVEVWDQGPGADGLLGWGRVWRAGGAPEEGGAGGGGDGRRVPLRDPRGDRLRVEVVDGDSPPLEDLEIAAAVRRPALVFALPAGDGGAAGGVGSATLYFGGGRALAPRYDVQGLVPSPPARTRGRRAEVGERLFDPARMPAAELGEPEANPRYEATPALAFAMNPGAALDGDRWAWRRPLAAHPSAEGLVRLRLTPEDLARARDDLADLRIAGAPSGEGGDGEAPRQWAYLLGEAPVRELREIPVVRVESEDGVSRYELVPDEAPLPLEGLTLRIDARFFDRPFVLRAGRGDREQVIAEGRLVLPPRDPRPVEIAFPDGVRRVDRLSLTVEDGNDAPLYLAGASGWVPLPEVYFAAPPGEYELLLGNPLADAPRYELARVRDVVLAVAAGEAETGDLEPNPDHSPGLAALLSPRAQTVFLWSVLGLAVVGLAVLTLRLAKREE